MGNSAETWRCHRGADEETTGSLKAPSSFFFADEMEPLKIHYKWRKENLQHTSVKQGMVSCALGSAGKLPWEIKLCAVFTDTNPKCLTGMLFLHRFLF